MTVGELYYELEALLRNGDVGVHDDIVVHTEHNTIKKIEGVVFDTSTGNVRMEVRSR